MTTDPRLPPQNLDAEMSVLGGILLDDEAINRVLEYIAPDDFYREAHRKIFRAMMKLSDRREPCDLVTLTEVLRKNGELDEIGGAAYLLVLVDYVPTAANIVFYCKIVKEKSVNRKLISVATGIVTRSYEDQTYVNAPVSKLIFAKRPIMTLSKCTNMVPIKFLEKVRK